jgi:hypothetical protein
MSISLSEVSYQNWSVKLDDTLSVQFPYQKLTYYIYELAINHLILQIRKTLSVLNFVEATYLTLFVSFITAK